MIHPSLESWIAACRMMQEEKPRLRCYLQWYPFSLLSAESWQSLMSEEFYSTFIENGSFILCEEMRYVTNGYLQKQGASLRESYLVAPVTYLYLLAFGVEYEHIYLEERTSGITLYAGNLEQQQGHYRKSYRAFCNYLKMYSPKYDYCLKTDISNFFGSIRVDDLTLKLQQHSNHSFSASDAIFLKALLEYCGKGRFPIIQNHPTLSFFATNVFLSDIDIELANWLNSNPLIEAYNTVRYVDDFYIFFTPIHGADQNRIQFDISYKYADLLREAGLTLNHEKLSFMNAKDVISSSITISCVDSFNNDPDVPPLFQARQIENFFLDIAMCAKNQQYRHYDFLKIIEQSFSSAGSTSSALASFRQCLFNNGDLFTDANVIESIDMAASFGDIVFSYNTEDIVRCVLKTQNEMLIKKLLNNLFKASKTNSWNSLCTLITITYLLERNMKHSDLLSTLAEHDTGLGFYCTTICQSDFSVPNITVQEKKTLSLLKDDHSSKVQFISYLSSKRQNNVFEGASYFRSFFDRVSTYYDPKKKNKTNSWIYSEDDLRTIYAWIPDAEIVIHNAENLRRRNPLVHAGSEMISEPSFREELSKMVIDLASLLEQLILHN